MKSRFKPKFHIKKGDTVVVITGDDKDLKKPRKVLEIITEKNRVLVEGVNIVTKHTKPSAQNTKGGIQKMISPQIPGLLPPLSPPHRRHEHLAAGAVAHAARHLPPTSVWLLQTMRRSG